MRKTRAAMGALIGAMLVVSGVRAASPPPVTYDAISDTRVYPKPELPKLGAAGFHFTDPTFGCALVRVSDEQTDGGNCILTPARSEQNPWNVDSTLFCVQNNGQENIPYRFDPATMTASRMDGLPQLPGLWGAATFSRHDPNLCYGIDRRRGVVVQFSFATKQTTDVIDVAKVTGQTAGYMDAVTISANDVLSVVFGGTQQDTCPHALVYHLDTGEHHLWNTKEGTVDGEAVPNAPHFTQHFGQIDFSGRYVMSLGPGVTGPIVWDIQSKTIYPVTVQQSGHNCLGYGQMINDIHQWVLRSLGLEGVGQPKALVQHPADEGYFAYDSHVSWNNARPDQPSPVLASTEHGEEAGDPRCAWGDEVIAVATDGSGRVWRFCHHRSLVHQSTRDRATNKYNFWDTPRGNVAQDGRFFMFTSNWGETLGTNPRGGVREDVFVVRLGRG